MPEGMVRVGKNKYKVINKKTGEVHAKGATEKKAKAQIRLLNAIEHNPNFRPRNR